MTQLRLKMGGGYSQMGALGDIEKTLVTQRKIHPEVAKYGDRENREYPYCHWLDTTPVYRILKAFKGLKFPGKDK